MSNFDFIATYVDLSDSPTYTTNVTLEGQLLKISFVWNERIGKRTIFIRNSADVCYLQNTILHPNESFELNSNAVFDDLPYKVVLQKVGDTNKVGNIYNWSKDFILCFYRTVDIETEKLNVKYGVNIPSTPIVPKPFSPPYNLIVEFKNDETNRIELNWKIDGFIDEQRYYCAETPIDPENLPAPKVVLANDVRSYIDAAVEVGKTYYVAVESMKNGVEKLSDVVSVVATNDPFAAFVISKLSLTSDLIDEKGKLWTPSKTPTFQDGALLFDGYFRASSSDLITPNYNSANYNIRCEIKPSRLDIRYQNVFAKRTNAVTYAEFLLRLEWSKILITACSAETWYTVQSNATLTADRFYKIEMDRKGNIVTLYVDDIPDLSFTLPTTVSLPDGSTSPVTIGALGDGTDPYYGLMRNFDITYGSSRH